MAMVADGSNAATRSEMNEVTEISLEIIEET